jgi:hypothetical protein
VALPIDKMIGQGLIGGLGLQPFPQFDPAQFGMAQISPAQRQPFRLGMG